MICNVVYHDAGYVKKQTGNGVGHIPSYAHKNFAHVPIYAGYHIAAGHDLGE